MRISDWSSDVCSSDLISTATAALPVLMARALLHGNASTFGILLGATGVGAVIGALAVSKVREYFGAEQAVRLCILVSSTAVVLMGFSHHLLLTFELMVISGPATIPLVLTCTFALSLSDHRSVL